MMHKLAAIMWTAFVLLLMVPVAGIAAPKESMPDETQIHKKCADKTFSMLEEERNAYRKVQYESDGKNVLGASARTEDLIPYLTLNYHALSCRLSMICNAVEISNRHPGLPSSIPHRPIGCSRMFAARGRWWDESRRDKVFARNFIPECDYRQNAEDGALYGVPPSEAGVYDQCVEWTHQILFEERNMLKLLVAQDSGNRSARKAVAVFYAAMSDIRDNSLPLLRKAVDFFGSVLHPIPCLLTQCN